MVKKALVTGCAGFIGSHLTSRLLDEGYEVVGIDCFDNYYSPEIKKSNIRNLIKKENFKFIETDILELEKIPEVSYIFHLAAQPGVRDSFNSFNVYVRNNILTTYKLLELIRVTKIKIKKFIYASSSSVYGDSDIPMKETSTPAPLSPYGVTKLAAENLCNLYYKNYHIPIISLRYFTVYGAKQRPDMAIYKFIRAALAGEKIVIFGDGNQTRDFTHVSDVVEATLLAAESDYEGELFNIGFGKNFSLNDVIRIICDIADYDDEKIIYKEKEIGDARDTLADITKAKKMLEYSPRIDLREGIEEEYRWLKEISRGEKL